MQCIGYNNSSIDQLTQIEQEHLYVAINREDYSDHEVEIQNEAVEFEVNMPLTAFKAEDLIACRGYCFNDDFKKMTPRSILKGNILTLYSGHDVVVFQGEEQWQYIICPYTKNRKI